MIPFGKPGFLVPFILSSFFSAIQAQVLKIPDDRDLPYEPPLVQIETRLPVFQPLEKTFLKGFRFEDATYCSNIRSAQLFVTGFPVSYPVLELGTRQTLTLLFDDLGVGFQDYSWKILLCNHDWTPASLHSMDYTTGFSEAPLNDYSFGYNTIQQYVRYRVVFPNQDIAPTRSGNYLLLVFRNNDPEQVILTRRFIVTENRVSVQVRAMPSSLPEFAGKGQQVNFSVSYKEFPIDNPIGDVQATIVQNWRWDNAVIGLSPRFLRMQSMDFSFIRQANFAGLNEFRWFDISNIRLLSERVRGSKFEENNHIFLIQDEARADRPYIFWRDINGKFIPRFGFFEDDNLQADYAWVHFSLKNNRKSPGGSVYLWGELCDWTLRPDCRLNWNPENSAYEGSLYLKQGHYNYMYAWSPDGSAGIQPEIIEGSSHEAENDYNIIIYFRSSLDRHDRIIAYQRVNSILNSR